MQVRRELCACCGEGDSRQLSGFRRRRERQLGYRRGRGNNTARVRHCASKRVAFDRDGTVAEVSDVADANRFLQGV